MSISEFPYKATINRKVVTSNYPNLDTTTVTKLWSGNVDLAMVNKGDGIPIDADYKIFFNTPSKALTLLTDDYVEVNYNGRTIRATIVSYSFSQLKKTTLYVKDNQINN